MKHYAHCIAVGLIMASFVVFITGLGSSPALAAVLTTQTISGYTDFSDEAAQNWQPLEVEGTVGAGNIVRTDFGALADLLGDDDSFLAIAEATQLSVLEYEFDAAQEIRIARFAILEGTVTADAAHLEYPTNIFDVETPTVTASFKFSKATIEVKPDGSTNVTGFDGKFSFSREGKQGGGVQLSHKSKSGVVTGVSIPRPNRVDVETTDKGLKITNHGPNPITVVIGGRTIEVAPGGMIDTALDNNDLELSTTDPAKVKIDGGAIKDSKVSGLPVMSVDKCCRECRDRIPASDIVGAAVGAAPADAANITAAACKAAPAECDAILDAALKNAPPADAQKIRDAVNNVR